MEQAVIEDFSDWRACVLSVDLGCAPAPYAAFGKRIHQIVWPTPLVGGFKEARSAGLADTTMFMLSCTHSPGVHLATM